MELLTSIAIILLIYILLDYVVNEYSMMGTKRMPGPLRLPLIGSAHYFLGSKRDLMEVLHDIFDKYPSPSFVKIPSKPINIIHHPEHVQTILTSTKALEKDDIYSFFNPWLGLNIFTEPVDRWRIHRKLIIPSFNSRNLEACSRIFSSHSIALIDDLSVHLNKEEFHITEYIEQCILQLNLESAMELKIEKSEKSLAFIEAVQRLVELISHRIKTLWLHPNFIFNKTRYAKEQAKYVELTNAFINDLVNDRNKVLTLRKNNKDPVEVPFDEEHKIMYDEAVKYYEKGIGFTKEEIFSNVRAALFAGNDTTTSTLDFVILLCASYPEHQEKIYEELHNIYGDEDPSVLPVRNEDLPHMDYLEQFIKETMRIFPIAPFLFRRLDDDIEVGGYTLKKGNTVTLSIMRLHRGKDYWKDPMKFDPGRFSPEQSANRHPYAYIPFSAGPRGCFGLKYAMILMKVMMATILRRYKLIKEKPLPIEEIQIKSNIVVTPLDPVRIKIEERIINNLHRKQN